MTRQDGPRDVGRANSTLQPIEQPHPGSSPGPGGDKDRDSSSIEGVLGHNRAVLLLHGDVSSPAVPQLEALLDSVIALGIPSLTVDLSDASATPDALVAINALGCRVHSLHLREGG